MKYDRISMVQLKYFNPEFIPDFKAAGNNSAASDSSVFSFALDVACMHRYRC